VDRATIEEKKGRKVWWRCWGQFDFYSWGPSDLAAAMLFSWGKRKKNGSRKERKQWLMSKKFKYLPSLPMAPLRLLVLEWS